MKRIICFVSSMDAGGAETFLMKIYRAMDKTHYQFDFIVNVKEKCFYDDEISNLGGYIFYSPMKSQNLFGNLWQNYKIVRRGNYYAALRMTSHSLGTIDLLMARLAGVKKLVLRSTNAGSTGENFSYMFHKVFSFLPRYIPTVKIAPSELAAEYLWGNGCVKNGEVKILHNGIPLDAYKFSKQIRQDKRKELGIEGKFVIGHIGRFNSQKNHKFLIEVFAKVYATNKEARLLLIGKGELENQIRRQVSLLGIRDAVIFAGVRNDIPEILMAMDVLVFPSLFEGMPNVIIEAQASGLACIISDKITQEVCVTSLVKVLSLKSDANVWKESIVNIGERKCDYETNCLKMAGYDIKDVVTNLETYLEA